MTQYPLCHVGCVSCVSCSDSYGNGGANCHAGFECRTAAMLEVLLGLGDVGVCRMLDLVMNLVLTFLTSVLLILISNFRRVLNAVLWSFE